jgi:hypothetical protein
MARFCLALLCAAICVAGCGSGSTTLLAPSPPSAQRCAVTLSVSSTTITSAGGSGTLTIVTNRECQWTVSGEASWVSFATATSGQGPGEVSYSVQPNRSTSPRSLQLSVLDQRAVISQESAQCTWNLSPVEIVIGPGGGETRAVLSTEDFCSWTVSSRASWIAITSDASGTGGVEIIFRIARNNGNERTGVIDVPGGPITIRQREAAPTPCTYDVSPLNFNGVSATASHLQVDVTTQGGCTWSASSNASWVGISTSAGTGSGRVELSVAQNTTPARSTTLLIAGHTVTVNQQSGVVCSYAIAPNTYSPASSGGNVQVSVTTTVGCDWTVTGNPSWASVLPTSGTGSSFTTIAVQANSGPARSTTFRIAGRDFRVEQLSATCAYSLDRTSFNLSEGKHTRKIIVTTQSFCPVAAKSNVSWIQVTSSPSFGSGEITIKVDENRGAKRTGTVTVSGQGFTRTVTVTQAEDD